jgi:hypothetical protein
MARDAQRASISGATFEAISFASPATDRSGRIVAEDV